MNRIDGATLVSATEKLNRLLRDAEEGFVHLNLGVEALVTLRDGVYLAFTKLGSEWKLMVKRPEVHSSSWLLDASRADRIAAAAMLSELHEQLLQNANELARDLASAIRFAENYLYPVEPAPLASDAPKEGA